MFTDHIPHDGNYTPIEGYKYPKHADKPQFSTQLGTYAGQLQTLYPAAPTSNQTNQTNLTQWNKSPLKHQQCTNVTKDFVFNEDEHPALQDRSTKHTNTSDKKTKEPNQLSTKPNSTSASAKEICKQILADMKQDISHIISSEIATVRTKIADKLTELHATINSDVKQQIAEVLQTIQTLNQCFTEVLNCTPAQIQPSSTTHTDHLQHHQTQFIHAQHSVHGSLPHQGRYTKQALQLYPMQQQLPTTPDNSSITNHN